MSRAQAIETLVGLLLLSAGAAHYVGWPPVALALGLLFVSGVVVQSLVRRRRGG